MPWGLLASWRRETEEIDASNAMLNMPSATAEPQRLTPQSSHFHKERCGSAKTVAVTAVV